MRENISNLNTLTEIHSNTLEDNEKNLAKLNEEIPKLNKLEEELKQSKDKTKSKFRKTKLKIQTISNQISIKFNFIESFLKEINKGDGKGKVLEFPKINENTFSSKLVSLDIQNTQEVISKKEFNDTIFKINNKLEVHDEEIKEMKNQSFREKTMKFEYNRAATFDKQIDPKLESRLNELSVKVFDIEINEKNILKKVEKMASKEESELLNKQLFLQIERLVKI